MLKTNNKKYIKNSLSAMLVSITNIFIGFISQRVFLNILNVEYLGLNGLFTNIISMLGIFELGIGSAIIFSLYKPLSRNDKTTIKGLMNFYRKAYAFVAVVVFVAGTAIMPFLSSIIKNINIDVNIYIAYFLFLLDVIFSYLLAYRRSILYADQKNYQINIAHIIYLILLNSSQLLLLYATKNYYIYLSVKIIARFAENYFLHRIALKQYPYLVDINKSSINKKTEKDIFKKIRALFLHKTATFIVLGSDNIIISSFIGIAEVGLYSNYLLITNALYQIIGQTISALTPTIGRKLAIDESSKSFDVFRRIRLVCFCLSCFASTIFLVCIQPLIEIWLGGEYRLGSLAVIAITMNAFQQLQRYAFLTFKEAAGIYYEDRFVPIFESAINILASIVLLKIFGLAGVIMGTIMSSLVLWCFSYPKYIYKKLFRRSYLQYLYETVGYLSIFVLCAAAAFLATSSIVIENIVGKIIINGTIAAILCAAIILLTLSRTDSFKYLKKKILHK